MFASSQTRAGIAVGLRTWGPAVVVGAALAAVAAVTGFISYTHICALTLDLHQSWKTAHLMPVSVDGQIIIGGAVLASFDDRRRWWGLLGVVPGLAESLFANFESGIAHGRLDAAWAMVAAQSFAVSSFLFERWLKGRISAGGQAAEAGEVTTEGALRLLLSSGSQRAVAAVLGVERVDVQRLGPPAGRGWRGRSPRCRLTTFRPCQKTTRSSTARSSTSPPEAARPTVVVQVFQTINIVVQHPHARVVARHTVYIPAGVVALARRRRRGRTLALDFAHAAKAAGDHANGLLWAQQHEAQLKARHERHERRMRLFIDLVKVSPAIGAVVLGLMVLLNVFLFIGSHRADDLAWSFLFAAHAVKVGQEIAAAAWLVALAAAAAVCLVALHEAGRRAGDLAPGWGIVAKPGDKDGGLVVTADTIVLALQNLADPGADAGRSRTAGGRRSTLLPVRDGRGYCAVFSAAARRDGGDDRRPAAGAGPEPAPRRDRGVAVDAERRPGGYVAAVGRRPRALLGKAAPEYPLLHEGHGRRVRGRARRRGRRAATASLIPVVGNNFVLGGHDGPGQVQRLPACCMLGCALDPLAELDVFVFANNGDFDAYAPRLARYRKGVEDDAIDGGGGPAARAVRGGRRARAAAGRAGRQEGDARSWRSSTRTCARVVSLFSECHELFGHPEYGELAGELAVKTAKRARKTAITLGFDTQSSPQGGDPAAARRAGQRELLLRRQDAGGATTASWATGRSPRASGRRSCGRAGTAARRWSPACQRRAVRAAEVVLRRGRRRHRL